MVCLSAGCLFIEPREGDVPIHRVALVIAQNLPNQRGQRIVLFAEKPIDGFFVPTLLERPRDVLPKPRERMEFDIPLLTLFDAR